MSSGPPIDTAVLRAVPRPLVWIDHEYKVAGANDAAVTMAGVSTAEDLIGRDCHTILYGRDAICPFCPGKKERSKPQTVQTNVGGQARTLQVSFSRPEIHDLMMLEMIDDVTELRREEQERFRIEKLAAIGTMMSGVAHELNNPLTGMELNLQNLAANLGTLDAGEVSRRLSMIRRDINRASRIVNDVLSFSRTEQARRHRADMRQVIERARSNVTRLYPALSRGIKWDVRSAGVTSFFFDAEKMERVYINLFRNSLQAFDFKRGRIRVRVRVADQLCRITVQDNAGGIPDDDLEQIFNPFYTRSSDGRGSGLGLSICHNIIKEHDGTISVSSHSGMTQFKIDLPAPGLNEH